MNIYIIIWFTFLGFPLLCLLLGKDFIITCVPFFFMKFLLCIHTNVEYVLDIYSDIINAADKVCAWNEKMNFILF